MATVTVSDSITVSESVFVNKLQINVSDNVSVAESYTAKIQNVAGTGTQISYAGNNLQTSNIITASIDHFSIPVKDAKMYAIAHGNKSAIPYINYPSKTIVVTGKVVDTSITNLDSTLDTFRSYFTAQDQNLDIDYNGFTRRYTATANSVTIDRPGDLVYANFSIEFVCTIPFGKDVNNIFALSNQSRTFASYIDNHSFRGTAPYQLPVATITLNSVTGGTNAYIMWGNNSTGETVAITRTWSNGDVLVIDSTQSTITVNGVAVNFTGAFPQFVPGDGYMGYIDSFTTRNFDITVTYQKAYT